VPMLRLAHIINPVIVNETSDLYIAQPITFETMRCAQEFAASQVDVRLFSAQYPEDRTFAPEFLQKTPDLDRSVLDMGEFSRQRKLPLIRDILDRLYHADEDADYLIYTNVDIAVMPHFYVTVAHLIRQGHDAFFINRRTISKNLRDVSDIPLMYAEVGEKHPGWDCFVFPRNVYPNYKLGDACIGVSWVGRLLLANMIRYVPRYGEFTDYHLTFHIGDHMAWADETFNDYYYFNREEFAKSLNQMFEESEVPTQAISELKRFVADVENDRRIEALINQPSEPKPFHQQVPLIIKRVVKKILRNTKRIICGSYGS
jgi:hypothetical protein